MSPAGLDALVAERNERGQCGCGCGGGIPDPKKGKPRRIKFLPDHRQRMYRRRVEAVARERGLEPRLSLRSLQGPTGTKDRSGYVQNGDSVCEAGKKPRKQSGRQVPYGKAVAVAVEMLVAAGHPRGEKTRVLAEQWMRDALPEKQRSRP
jgi:hypothetical protein